MPTPLKMRYVMAYDVSDDRKRAQLANRLLDYGVRVQKSVFEAELTREDAKEILLIASKYIASGDSFRLYPLCKSCMAGFRLLGQPGEALTCDLRIL